MSSTLRKMSAVLLLASFVAAAPSHAASLGRRPFDGAARIESAARGFFAYLLRFFDFRQAAEKSDTGSTMDPNGNH